ncbi:MAG: SRPBCC domain-containing protein [Bacteroidota bacterium]
MILFYVLINKEVTITRTINAPRELVYKAFTDPQMMMQWWGPHGFTNQECEMDVRVNGKWKINMHSPELGFPNHWCEGIFHELNFPEKLVFSSRAFLKDDGSSGLEGMNTVTLIELNGKTKLTIHATLTKLDKGLEMAAEGMEEGWSQSLEKLNAVFSKTAIQS